MSAKSNANANNAAKTISRMNALKKVKARDIVPFPIAWNILAATIPNGISTIKKHKILRHSITLSESTAASAEYENINDNGSAKTKRNAQIMAEDIIPNLIP